MSINVEPCYYTSRYTPLSRHSQAKGTYNQRKTINEYTLNAGVQLHYTLLKNTSIYLVASSGPTIINSETERLNKGLSFSNIVGTGVNFRTSFMLFDLRFSIRHVSNAGMSKPNRGYNSLNFETGFSIPIK